VYKAKPLPLYYGTKCGLTMSNSPEAPEDNLPYFFAKNTALRSIKPDDELLHPDSFAQIKDDSATETQYFGFSIPEHRIHSIMYVYWHPNLKVVSGGLFVAQGIKPTIVHAELCDFRTFMSDQALRNDLHDYRLDNGYGVKILDPNRRFHITYDAPAQQNSVDLIAEAILPGVMFADGNHFEQTMKMRGKLKLRGREYAVDSYSVRDRSWGKPRPEAISSMPPMSWMVGTFNDGFSFNCTTFDQSSHNPLLKGQLEMPDNRSLNGGWVWRDGKLGRIVTADKRVARGPGGLVAASAELRFIDEHGRAFNMLGSLLASCPIQAWTNSWSTINLMSWECDGMKGYGDHQEMFLNDYLNASPN